MAIEDIFRALEDQADLDCQRILDEAKAEADRIMAEAQAEAEQYKSRKLGEAESAARRKAVQKVNAARLTDKKEMASMRGRAVQRVFDDARASMSQVRRRPDYEQMFRSLAEEALKPLSGALVVSVDPADQALAERVLAGFDGVQAKVNADLSCGGGLLAMTEDGRIFRRNTLEDRLTKMRQVAQSQIAEILFS